MSEEIKKRHQDLGTSTLHVDGVAKIWINHYLHDVSQLLLAKEQLKNFAIWMTGCGYDFTQHEYFCQQRDKLLTEKDKETAVENLT